MSRFHSKTTSKQEESDSSVECVEYVDFFSFQVKSFRT